MKRLSHTETSALQKLVSWSEDLAARIAVSMKPKHRADQIAAAMAETGNPSGA